MNREAIDRIADAVLYEGYILYPYRPSIKNRQRWTFGGLYPESYCRERGDGSSSGNQTECLVRGTVETMFDARVRFLHLTDRRVGEIDPPLPSWPADGNPPSRPVEVLSVGGEAFHSWQEAEPREAVLGEVSLGELLTAPRCRSFTFPGGRRAGPLRGAAGEVVGVLSREQRGVRGQITAAAAEAGDGLFRVTLRVENRTPMGGEAEGDGRAEAQLRSLASTHTILGTRFGAFVSLIDPPDRWREAAAACRNVGSWPVLVGEEGQADTMLAAPIILYDYPQVAPESPGDFFDGTEIDEMLTLRILALSDAEKATMASVDARARDLLTRTEATAREQLPGLHGTIRGLRPVPGEAAP